MSDGRIGFIGLGNMGGPIATNIAAGGHDLIVFDAAGTVDRAPAGAAVAASIAEVAAAAETVFLSLPDGPVVAAVAEEVAESNARITSALVDLSTIGIAAAQQVHARLSRSDIAYLDAPVSGGTAGARAATIAVMCAGDAALFQRLESVLASMSRNVFHVGDTPGQGQAMKLANNFLSATAMTATSEAVAFGVAQGLDMAQMLDVLNASSGQNTATADKFPNRILPAKYDAGFTNTLMTKDVTLYLENVRAAGTPDTVSAMLAEIWQRFQAAEPGTDFTRIYPFVRDGR